MPGSSGEFGAEEREGGRESVDTLVLLLNAALRLRLLDTVFFESTMAPSVLLLLA